MSKTIFVTTGTQLPFPRLVDAVNRWCANQSDINVIAQTCSDVAKPKHFKVFDFLEPKKYKDIVSNAQIIVSHAGVGSIITAHEQGLPIIIMPRRFDLGEHRNDHQMATVEKFKNTQGVYIAKNEEELVAFLNDENLLPCINEGNQARKEFITQLSAIISG